MNYHARKAEVKILEKNLQIMLKKVTMLYIIVGVFTLGISMVWSPKYALPAVCGVLVVLLCFYGNALVMNYAVNKKGGSKFSIFINFFMRVVLVSIIGLLFFIHNKYDVLAYMLGYSSNFLVMLFYGVSIKYAEGK